MCGECETFDEFRAGQSLPSGLVIMPAGDSITAGTAIDPAENVEGAWRTQLWECLGKAGLSATFVGSQADSGPATLAQRDHEGHAGFKIADWTAGDFLAALSVDVVAALIGTNDCYAGDMAGIDTRLAALLDYCRASPGAPDVFVFNMPETTLGFLETNYLAYNALIPGVLVSRPWAHIVDMRDASAKWDASTCMTRDQVHPNATGDQRIAEQLFRALRTWTP